MQNISGDEVPVKYFARNRKVMYVSKIKIRPSPVKLQNQTKYCQAFE